MVHFKDLLKQKFNESEDLANISKLDNSIVNSDYSEESDVVEVISKDEIFQILMELDPDEVSFIGQYIKMGLDDLESIYNGDELDESFEIDDFENSSCKKKIFDDDLNEFDASKLRKTQRLRRKSIDIKRIANNLRKKIGQRAQIRLKNLKAKRYGRQHKAQRKRYQRIRKVLKLNKTGYWAKNAKIKRIKKIIRGK
jgi:hypothetical protein